MCAPHPVARHAATAKSVLARCPLMDAPSPMCMVFGWFIPGLFRGAHEGLVCFSANVTCLLQTTAQMLAPYTLHRDAGSGSCIQSTSPYSVLRLPLGKNHKQPNVGFPRFDCARRARLRLTLVERHPWIVEILTCIKRQLIGGLQVAYLAWDTGRLGAATGC